MYVRGFIRYRAYSVVRYFNLLSVLPIARNVIICGGNCQTTQQRTLVQRLQQSNVIRKFGGKHGFWVM